MSIALGLSPRGSAAWERLRALLREKAYRKGTFTLASGKQSDFFIDCKRAVLSANGHYAVGAVISELLHDDIHRYGMRYVAGVELGGCPLASAVSMFSGATDHPVDVLYVRKAAKDHGTKVMVEGAPPRGILTMDAPTYVALLEDVITTGGSSLRAVETLQREGFSVPVIVALVDRCEGGAEAIQAAGIKLISVFSREDFVSVP